MGFLRSSGGIVLLWYCHGTFLPLASGKAFAFRSTFCLNQKAIKNSANLTHQTFSLNDSYTSVITTSITEYHSPPPISNLNILCSFMIFFRFSFLLFLAFDNI
jgi:hypothetical protein